MSERKVRVLMIDDDNSLRKALVRNILHVLKEMPPAADIDIIQVGTKDEAEEILYGSSTPDIVLCDLLMPMGDGKEVKTRYTNEWLRKLVGQNFLVAACSDWDNGDERDFVTLKKDGRKIAAWLKGHIEPTAEHPLDDESFEGLSWRERLVRRNIAHEITEYGVDTPQGLMPYSNRDDYYKNKDGRNH